MERKCKRGYKMGRGKKREEPKEEIRKADGHSRKIPKLFKFFSVHGQTEEEDNTTSKDISQNENLIYCMSKNNGDEIPEIENIMTSRK
jgi:hypothetical protein